MTAGRVDGRTLRHQHRRPELLSAVTEYVLDNGVGDVSLRPMAHALGVTHATLLRHFGSKEQLLLEVSEKVRSDLVNSWQQDEELKAALRADELVRLVWARLCEPAEQRQFILLFELVGRAARRPADTAVLAGSIVEEWLLPIESRLRAAGWSSNDARTAATFILAQVRGLQLDLLLTGDRTRVDAALEAAIAVVQRPEILQP